MDILREIQRDMAFRGWKGDPTRGFHHKEDADGKTIAMHHDSTWAADYEECQARAERLFHARDLENRERFRAFLKAE